MMTKQKSEIFILTLIVILAFGVGLKSLHAETNTNPSYVPLIGISSVSEPQSLPKGPGNVTYKYAVKNFIQEIPLNDVQVTDDKCSPIKFVEGDDNGDAKLDYSETWRYSCTTKLSVTTQSIATAIGTANNLPAAHKAYTTVVVGSDIFAPQVNIINITKVAYPLTLPIGGGDITFTYRVNNPGVVPLDNVVVVDDKCGGMSNKLGDTNGNNLLDTSEVWTYYCKTKLSQTTTNTVKVEASANGLKAVGYATITVTVALPASPKGGNVPGSLPQAITISLLAGTVLFLRIITWATLSIILAVLVIFYFLIRKNKSTKIQKKLKFLLSLILITVVFVGLVVGVGAYLLRLGQPNQDKSVDFISPHLDTLFGWKYPTGKFAIATSSDKLFGWKYPTVKFPITGPGEIAYSDIRDPGGMPQGLPVRLKIPIIGVDSAIEDALITPEGRMDVPAGSVNVAWFALGPHPGQVGSAVIGGHFGISKGVPFVFYKLDQLKIGDKVYIEDDKGATLIFQVRSIKLFNRNDDATTVFTSEDGLAHLNLITCEGIWNQINGTYPERRVVFTEAIPAESVVDPTSVATYRSLSLGVRGADVVMLQTVLEQKGLLNIPSGVAKGYFGQLTRTAIIKYQKSVGLPAVGIFDSLTRAKLIPEQTTIATKIVLPETALLSIENASVSSSTIISFLMSLYFTPVDGLITTFLLISIIFVLFIIIRRQTDD